MTIRLQAKGELRECFGEGMVEVPLAEGSTLAGLLAAVEARWGGSLPPHLWDTEAGRFRGPVVFMIGKTPVRDMETPLRDGEDVSLFKVLVGG